MVANEPRWLTIARSYMNVAESPGKATTPVIAKWLRELKAWWTDDETPWCGVAVAAWMREAGQPVPKHWYRAKAWLEWGYRITQPAVGAVVVYERAGGGHVGLVVGVDPQGRILTLGGNQGNKVSVAPFDRARVIGYRWAANMPPPGLQPVPTLASTGPASTNEA